MINKCCTRCYKIQAITEYGEYKSSDVIDDELQVIMVPYKTCKTCRDKDDIYRYKYRMQTQRHIVEKILEPSSDEEDAIWGGKSD